MPLAVLVAAIAGYVYALVAKPCFRRWGLGLGAAVLLILGAYFLTRGNQQRPQIAAADLTLDALHVERSARGADLSGRVQNGSRDFRLIDMTLRLRLRDCPVPAAAAAQPAETRCPVIGEATAIARPEVPPGQIRGFTANFVFTNLPPLLGNLAWDWEITGTRAGPP